MTVTDQDSLIIFDTTLRDGEQSPGVTLTVQEKVAIARQLSLLGVDVCEAGFPIASEGDFEAVERIAKEVGPLTEGRDVPMTIAGLSRSVEKDIQRAYDAVKHAPKHRIHTFIATSDIHLKYKLKMSREECVKRAVKTVQFAKSLCEDIEWSAEDAGRSDKVFLCEIIGAVISAGATTINIPDTVGYCTPEEYGDLIEYLRLNTSGGDKVIWSTHCHNDLGLATANTIAGVRKGARQVEVTINGIGERAGNTSLEEIVMTAYVHADTFPVKTKVDTAQICRTSQMVQAYTGMDIQKNKAIVGANAFAHESGIHQDGMLKHQATYEIIKPEVIGLGKSSLVLGKHSGRHAFKSRIVEMGYSGVTDDQIQRAFDRFKRLADTKKVVTESELHALLKDEVYHCPEVYSLVAIQVTSSSGTQIQSTATVSLAKEDQTLTDAAIGNGPVDAIFKAIDRLVHMSNTLIQFEIKAITGGSDALGEVSVRIADEKQSGDVEDEALGPNATDSIVGHGADSDILFASGKAYVNAVNKLLAVNSEGTHRPSKMSKRGV